MGQPRLEVIGLAVAFLLLGSLAVYTYNISNQLDLRNSQLGTEVSTLQGEVSALTSSIFTLQSNLNELQYSFSSNLTSLRGFVLMTNSSESKETQQIATIQASLQQYQSQLSTLDSEIKNIGTSNSIALSSIAFQLQNITLSMRNLRVSINSLPPLILLRVAGTALGAFVERPDGLNYLRLMEIGSTSGVESSLATYPFNATVPGETIQWKAVANDIASDRNHTTWPMVLENTPGGTDALEFEDVGGFQEAAVVSNGVRNSIQISWNPTVPNTFAIEVVIPGQLVDFFINGHVVANFTSGVPYDDFLIAGSEVKGFGSAVPLVATLDTYGGMLGSD